MTLLYSVIYTNEPSRRDSEGDWFAPNGTKVGNYTDSTPRDVPGFGRTRGPHVVRLDGNLFSKRYVTQCFVCSTVFICNFISVTSSFVPSSMVAGDSVTLTSSIFMTSEVDVTIPSSTTESTTSFHSTPTQTVVYTSSEGNTTPTPTVGPNLPFYYNSSATPTQTEKSIPNNGLTGLVPVVGSVICSLVILLVIVTLILLILR